MKQRLGILGPLVLVIIGLFLLFNNIGMLPLGFWGTVWRFWPVILILIGLDILATHSESRKTYILFILLGTVIVIGVIAIALTWQAAPRAEARSGQDLNGAQSMNRIFIDLSNANFSGAHLEGSRLIFADMSNANLEGASLNGALLVFVDLSNANLNNMDVEDARFIFVDMSNAELEGTDMHRADLIFTLG
ncbi:MAG: pentapeptide repeat-containing protein [Methanosarcinales archaeon]|nr:pentapeptide repeat-containing protein [Methanosarcinales archaeon]